ncbi:MAG: hypothetical protein N2110_03910 [Flavobacteriales bacterium]|nr:hypothetical protein [Flavobacteriales bacterium]
MAIRLRYLRGVRILVGAFKFFAILGVAAMVGGGLYLTFFLADDIKSRALQVISRTVRTEISMSDIELDLLSDFPLASLRLSDVRCRGVPVTMVPQDLFSVRQVWLSFSLWDFLRGRLTFKKLVLRDGQFDLFRNEHNKANWEIINPHSSVSGKAGQALLNINRVEIRQVSLRFQDGYLKNMAWVYLDHFGLAGNLQDEEPEVIVEGQLRADSIGLANGLSLGSDVFRFLVSLKVNPMAKEYLLKTLDIQTQGGNQVQLKGKIAASKGQGFLVEASGKLDLNQVTHLEHYLIRSQIGWPEHLALAAGLRAEIQIAGVLGPTEVPNVRLRFDLKNGEIFSRQHAEKGRFRMFASGDFRWNGNSWRIHLPVWAVVSDRLSRLRGSLKAWQNSTFGLRAKVGGALQLPDLAIFLPELEASQISGVVETSQDILFYHHRGFYMEGQLKGSELSLVLPQNEDSLTLHDISCTLRSIWASVEIAKGKVWGNSFQGSLFIPFGPDVDESQKLSVSRLEFETFVVPEFDHRFWSAPIAGPWRAAHIFSFLRNRWELSAEAVVVRDVMVKDARISFCPMGSQKKLAILKGFVCESPAHMQVLFHSAGSEMAYYLRGWWQPVKSECLTHVLDRLMPSYPSPELQGEPVRVEWAYTDRNPQKLQNRPQWNFNVHMGAGALAGTFLQAEAPDLPIYGDKKRIFFQSLHHQAWSDSLSGFHYKTELRLKGALLRAIHTPKTRLWELEAPEPLLLKTSQTLALSEDWSEPVKDGNKLIFGRREKGGQEGYEKWDFRNLWSQLKAPDIQKREFSTIPEEPTTEPCQLTEISHPSFSKKLVQKPRRK